MGVYQASPLNAQIARDLAESGRVDNALPSRCVS